MRCLATDIDRLKLDSGVQISALQWAQGHDAKYRDLRFSEVDHDTRTWTSLWKDIGDFIKGKKVGSKAELAARFPELNKLVDTLLKLEGDRTAFSYEGLNYSGDGRNYCFEDESQQMSDQDRGKLLQKVYEAKVRLTGVGEEAQKSFDCHVACFTYEGKFACTPKGDFDIEYGRQTMGQYSQECNEEAGSPCASVPAVLDGQPVKQVYDALEDNFTRRADEFMTQTMIDGYLRAATLNMTSDQELARNIKALREELAGPSCADKTSWKRSNGVLKQLDDGAAKLIGRIQSKELTADSITEYRGRMAQAAECSQRLAERYAKLQYLLKDNGYQRGTIKPETGVKAFAANAVLSLAGPGMSHYVGDLARASIDKPLDTSDGDHLQPVCGGMSSMVVHAARQTFKLHLDGADYTVDPARLGALCDRLRAEAQSVASQLDSIANTYPVLFSSDPADRAAVATKILAQVPAGDLNPHLTNYRRGVSVMEGYKARTLCVAQGADGPSYANDVDGKPLQTDDCSAVPPGPGGVKYRADDARLEDPGHPEAGGQTCLEVAAKKPPTAAQAAAAGKVLGEVGDQMLKKFREGIRKVACTAECPSQSTGAAVANGAAKWYTFGLAGNLIGSDSCTDPNTPEENRDLVVSDPKLSALFLGSCTDCPADQWLVCMRRKLKAEEDVKKDLAARAAAARKKMAGDFMEAVSFGMELLGPISFGEGLAGMSLALEREGLVVAAQAAGRGMLNATKFGVGMTVASDIMGLVPSAREKQQLQDAANLDEASVFAGYGSAQRAVQSVSQALESSAQVDPYTQAVVMGVIFGGLTGEHGKGYLKVPDEATVGADVAAIERATSAESFQKWREGHRDIAYSKAATDFITDQVGMDRLANLSLEERIKLYENWRASTLKTSGASRVKAAEERLASALNDEIYKKFEINLSEVSLRRLSVEDRIRFLSDPAFQGLDGTSRYLALIEHKAPERPVVSRNDTYHHLLEVGDTQGAAAHVEQTRQALARTYGSAVSRLRQPEQVLEVAMFEDFLARQQADPSLTPEFAADIKGARRELGDIISGRKSCPTILTCLQKLEDEIGFHPASDRVRAPQVVLPNGDVRVTGPASDVRVAGARTALEHAIQIGERPVQLSGHLSLLNQTASDSLAANGVSHQIVQGPYGPRIVISPEGDAPLNRYAARMKETRGTEVVFDPALFFEEPANRPGVGIPNHTNAGYNGGENRLYLSKQAMLDPENAARDPGALHETGHSNTAGKDGENPSAYGGAARAKKDAHLPGPNHPLLDAYDTLTLMDESNQYYKDSTRASGRLTKALTRADSNPETALNDAKASTIAGKLMAERAQEVAGETMKGLSDGTAKLTPFQDQYGKTGVRVTVQGSKGEFTYTVGLPESKGMFDPANRTLLEKQLAMNLDVGRDNQALLDSALDLLKKADSKAAGSPERAAYAAAANRLLAGRGIDSHRPLPTDARYTPIEPDKLPAYRAELAAEGERFAQQQLAAQQRAALPAQAQVSVSELGARAAKGELTDGDTIEAGGNTYTVLGSGTNSRGAPIIVATDSAGNRVTLHPEELVNDPARDKITVKRK